MSAPVQVYAGVIVFNGRMLLTQRSPRRDFPNAWETPGGKMEPSDDGFGTRTVQREIEEEIGVLCTGFDVPSTLPCGLLFEPPICAVAVQLSFIRVTEIACHSLPPRMHQVVGLGWFSVDDMAALPLVPGNRVLLEHLRAHGMPPSTRVSFTR